MALFKTSFFSECYQRLVPVNVLVPLDAPLLPGAVREPKRYKTLYLLHGYKGNCDDWLHNSLIARISEQFDLAVVMPDGANGFYVDQPESNIHGSEFIGRELIEFTRKTFSLSGLREDTVIAGLSMGGYGAFYNALKHSGVFGHAIPLSPPVKVIRYESEYEPEFVMSEFKQTDGYFKALHGDLKTVNESDRNLALFAKQTLESGQQIPNLYLACGYNDSLVPESRELHEQLLAIGFPHVYEEGPGTHDWPFWNEFLRRGLVHALGEPDIPPHPFWVEKTDYERGRA